MPCTGGIRRRKKKKTTTKIAYNNRSQSKTISILMHICELRVHWHSAYADLSRVSLYLKWHANRVGLSQKPIAARIPLSNAFTHTLAYTVNVDENHYKLLLWCHVDVDGPLRVLRRTGNYSYSNLCRVSQLAQTGTGTQVHRPRAHRCTNAYTIKLRHTYECNLNFRNYVYAMCGGVHL